jgi:hypothetical protein
MSFEQVKERFPSLFDHFNMVEHITQEELSNFYKAKKCVVVKENAFKDKSNMYKMHYMIENCYNLIDEPDSYDLIIRIRPDKELKKFDLDWNDIYHQLDKKILISDSSPYIHPAVGLVIGDQFAVSVPSVMAEYSKTFSKVMSREGVFAKKQYAGFRPHMTLFLSMLEQDIEVTKFDPKNVLFGRMLSANMISKNQLIELIKKDLNDEPKTLEKFILAIEKDYEGLE